MRTASADTSDAVALLRAEHAVARILADASDLTGAYPELLRAIAEMLDWEVAAAWAYDAAEPGVLRRVAFWHAAAIPDSSLAALRETDELPTGLGLPGRVWKSGVPAWIVDVTADPNFPRADAARAAGLHSAFCFPIETSAGTAGALEFLTSEPRMPDDHLLDTMASLGRQIGHYIDRARATAALGESEARTRAILEAALDCVVTMDEHGCVVEFNPAA